VEVELKTPEDIKKLEGWTITGAHLQREGPDPQLVLQMSHPLAGTPIQVAITPVITFGRNGNIMIANTALNLKTQDIPLSISQK
jgi:hypothetical protein